MSAAEIVLIVLAVLALVSLTLWSVAQRLDRLHRREYQTRATLEAQLVRRADTAAELAGSGELDPASAVLVADAAMTSMGATRLVGDEEDAGDAADTAEREQVESDLSRTLRAALREADDDGAQGQGAPAQSVALAEAAEPGADVTSRVRQVQYRVQLARRFHNDAVVAIQRIRRLSLVRWFRLAGYAPRPTTFEMDDAPV